MIPAQLIEHAKLGKEVVIAGVNDRLEIWDRAAWRKELQKSKGVRRMLPNALQTSATDHVPVLAGEVRELLAVRPGRRAWMPPSAPADTPRCSPPTFRAVES